MSVYCAEAPAWPLEAVNSSFDGPIFPYVDPFIRVTGIIIEDHQLYVGQHQNRATYELLGGAAIIGEDLRKALAREMNEEAQIEIDISELEFFGYYFDRADGDGRPMLMAAWLIGGYEGRIVRNREIRRIRRIKSTSELPKGSTLQREIIPDLLAGERIH